MVTNPVQTATGAPHAVSGVRPCIHCGAPVSYEPTHLHGRRLPFDAALRASAGNDASGWLPGLFYVGDTLHDVLAPVHLHPQIRRYKARYTYRLHRCEQAA